MYISKWLHRSLNNIVIYNIYFFVFLRFNLHSAFKNNKIHQLLKITDNIQSNVI